MYKLKNRRTKQVFNYTKEDFEDLRPNINPDRFEITIAEDVPVEVAAKITGNKKSTTAGAEQ